MRPITNILLVLALICYVFLPFLDISLMGTVTGLGFTAGTISQFQSFNRVLLALIPFAACFGAVALNCLKGRWWVLGSIACILLWMWFYSKTSMTYEISLQHAPEVTPDNDLGEGFSIIGTGIGHKISYVLTILSLISALISLLPFKFNETIEKAVDDTFEGGRRHVREEFKRLENAHKGNKSKGHLVNSTPPPVEDKPQEHEETPIEDKEDPTRFMPKE
ncbi:MAG: hypothetical protein J5503_02440 [Muribaculaceae bacterium]|nr:hypothetical protein [Muribaculaceae bacterium]